MGARGHWFESSHPYHKYSSNCLIDTPDQPTYNPTIQLQRVVKIFEHLNTIWDVIATMSIEEYERFRSKLGTASGKQSEQYIEVEILLKKLPLKWYHQHKHFLSGRICDNQKKLF